MNSQRLLERFLRYVRIETTAVEGATTYPSSAGQLKLGRMLRDELLAIGLTDARQDQHGIVLATLPATCKRSAPTIAWFAHVDTSPETTGKNVQPQVWRYYEGGDLALPGDRAKVVRVAENPELRELVGKTIITTDGTTLLGADDKAGVAVITEAVAWLAEHPQLEHGPIRVCFTCDEEIGHGVDHINLSQLGAVVGYTLDGAGANEIDVETFSADLAKVCVRGVNIHPMIAKGRMVNSVRVAAAFVDRLPRDRLSPETTEGRDGFLHPYHLEGGVAEVQLRILLRDFQTAALEEKAKLLRTIAAEVMREFPGSSIDVQIQKQYRNMAEGWPASRVLSRMPKRPCGGWGASPSSRSFAAARTVRGSPSWDCPRLISPPASTIRTRRWSGPALKRWPPRRRCLSNWPACGQRSKCTSSCACHQGK